MQVALIGPGRVGRTLAAALPKPLFDLGPVLSRTATSTRRAVREMDQGSVARSIEDLAASDVVLVAVPDQALPQVARDLAHAPFPLSKKIVMQTSRVHDSSKLESVRRMGAAVGSLQPIYALGRPGGSLAGVHWAVEGDPAATRLARKMIRGWNGECQLVRRERKIHLGIAASMASDLFAGILELAVQQMSVAGFSRKRGIEALSRILAATLSDYVYSGRNCRLGPLLASDEETIRRYVEALDLTSPQNAVAYREIALQALSVLKTHHRGFAALTPTIQRRDSAPTRQVSQ